MVKSTLEQLQEIEQAISAITNGGQEYTTGGRTLRRADLKELLSERTRLQNQLNDETYGTRTVVGWGR